MGTLVWAVLVGLLVMFDDHAEEKRERLMEQHARRMARLDREWERAMDDWGWVRL